MKFHVKTESGLGDFLSQYLGEGLFKHFKAIKELGFQAEIINYDYTHNHCTLNIAELNPYFKSEQKPWGTWADFDDPTLLKLEGLFDWSKIPCETPQFYLTDKENKWIEQLPQKYYCLHAQAGVAERALCCHINLEDLIVYLTKKMPVVLLGGSGERIGQGRRLDETYTWQHSDLINCIDRQNARTQCEAIKRCTKFIGSFSAYEVVASYLNKPAVIGCPLWLYNKCKNFGGGYYTKAGKQKNLILVEWGSQNFCERFWEAITCT